MKSLFDSVKEFVSSLDVGAKLKYITGQNTLEVVSVDPNGDWVKFKRDAANGNSSEHKVNISSLEEVIKELESGKAVHFDTFFKGGGHLRSTYETLLAHCPRVSWCKIDNKKHLRAFDHEVHDPAELWRSDSDTWSNPEWAMASLVYLNHVKKLDRSTIGVDLERLLVASTSRNASSWQRRISNLKAAEDGGVYDGGETTKTRCLSWLDRTKNSIDEVAVLAGWAIKDDANSSDMEMIGNLLGIKLERVESDSLKNEDNFVRLARCFFAKPFLILTGNSGTGKTRMAETIAATYRNHEEAKKATNVALVPVGADWTDSRAVVGFVNHLREDTLHGISGKRPVYQSTAVVDLLLSADSDRDRPHFLILDEMNLSHVERYFADLLSAMESRDGRIRFHDEGPRDQDDFRLPRFEGDPVGVPRSVAYPRNLFVTGTVNIDETTYMFSPKVLDRAHVIEFVVDREDIAAFLDDPVPLQHPKRAPDAQAKAFLQLALDARGGSLAALPGNISRSVNSHLVNWLELLQLGRFEFAFRTANEIQRYLRVCHHLAADKAAWAGDKRVSPEDRKAGKGNWLSDLDDEILQKVLPRLHGSRSRVGPLLGALTSYAHSGDVKLAKSYFPEEGAEIAEKSIGDPDFTTHKEADAAFPRSFSKLKTMARVLVEEQFVSFIC